MPQNKDLKRLVRARMAETGENYTQALAQVLSRAKLEPLPAAWCMTGSRPQDYELGLLPETLTCEATRVVQLRLRATVVGPAGFGALMQSIAATRYVGRRLRFSAKLRAHEITDWAGLWLRIDGPTGPLTLDNMQDRPLRGSTDWTQDHIVLDVAQQATTLHFGALLTGAGALDLTRPRLQEDAEAVPTKRPQPPLPDEPQALDFGVAQ